MTYRDLANEIRQLEPSQLDQTVTVYDEQINEYIPVAVVDIATKSNDVVEEGQPILVLR